MKVLRTIGLMAAAVLLAASTPAHGQDAASVPSVSGPLPSGVRVGASLDAIRLQLGGGGYKVELLDAKSPGQLTDGLLDTGLLASINHFQIDDHPFLNEGQGAGQSFLIATRPREELIIGFVRGVSRAILQKKAAGVARGADPFNPGRLGPIKSQLAALVQVCAAAPIKRDRYSNRFEFLGSCYGGKGYVRYRPERSQIALLVVGGASAVPAAQPESGEAPQPGDILWEKKFGDENAPGAVEIKTRGRRVKPPKKPKQ